MKFLYPQWENWPKNRPVIIAEVGINHGGDEILAWEMIRSAHDNGADFVKLQSFITKDFFHPSLPYFSDMKAMELSFEAQNRLFEKAGSHGIRLITTPFDFLSADFVNEFDPPAFKIASMDNDYLPLIKYVAKKNKPVFVSCGMADLGEIEKIVHIFEETGNNKLILLHCVSNYPTDPGDLNLAMIDFLRNSFDCFTGLSDHSIGLDSSYVAASLGAVAIEKHYTIDRSLSDKYPESDNDISILPEELKDLRRFYENFPIMLGYAPRQFSEKETIAKKEMRRGLYAKRDIEIGEPLNLENTIILRPVQGIKAGMWYDVKEKPVKKKIRRLEPILYSDLGM